jgi:hypothetical protein
VTRTVAERPASRASILVNASSSWDLWVLSVDWKQDRSGPAHDASATELVSKSLAPIVTMTRSAVAIWWRTEAS